jgi:hypothetical protein
MEEELPPELRARRHAIYAQVTRRGRAQRHRRLGAVFLAVAVVVAMPIVAVALNSTSDGHNQRIATFAPSTTGEADIASRTSTTPPSEVTSTAPLLSTTSTQQSATTTATSLVCRNSTDPQCGPLVYDPPITNQPATLTATTTPATPTAGEVVTFTVHTADPDSFIDPGMFCGQVSFGDGNDTGCQVACAANGPQYGPWAPPPPTAGDATFTMTHTYPRAGTYTARFSFTADECGPRPSPASTSITVHISS